MSRCPTAITEPLILDTNGGIWQGSGTFQSPTTGLKIWNDSGVGRIAAYNGGTAQFYTDTNGNAYFAGTVNANAGAINGALTIGASGGIWQGTGTFASPTTGLKIYNSSGVGIIEFWQAGAISLCLKSNLVDSGLGVGTLPTAASKLRVAQTYVGASSSEAAFCEHTRSVPAAGAMTGLVGEVNVFITSGTQGDAYAVSGVARASGSGGTTTELHAVEAGIVVGPGATATKAMYFHAAGQSSTGTIDTLYGLKIEDYSGSATTVWGVHTSGNVPSSFGYHVTIAGGVNIGAATNAAIGALNLREISAPGAPAAEMGTLYLDDNGAGKTRLMIRFASGVAQMLAQEP